MSAYEVPQITEADTLIENLGECRFPSPFKKESYYKDDGKYGMGADLRDKSGIKNF